MSQITENTVVIKPTEQHHIMIAYDVESRLSRMRNLKKVYHSEKTIIYTFDCNGDPFYYNHEEYNLECDVIETNYFDNEPLYTRVRKKNGVLEDTRLHAYNYIKKMIGEGEYLKIKDSLRYSDGRI